MLIYLLRIYIIMPEQGNPNFLPDTLNNTGGKQAPAGSLQHIRALAMPFLKGQMITEADGSLLIKDVPMLAEGTWIDSAQRTPLRYTAKSLEASIGNWLDNSGWSRHLGGVPRDVTDKVSEAVNPHYGQFTDKEGKTHNGMLSDVRVYPFTQKQRDMQEMIRHNLISFVSMEHGGDEVYNPVTRENESGTLYYTGFAFVNKGACKVCRLNEAELEHYPWDQCIEDQMKKGYDKETAAKICGSIKARNNSEELMENKELEAAITAAVTAATAPLMKELEAVKAQKPAEVKVEIPKELSEAIGKVKELSETNTKLEARLKALEETGVSKTSAGAQTKELAELPEYFANVDRKTGTIGA